MTDIISLQSLAEQRSSLGKVVLVTGNFNILHPGHIRLLRFAKSCGDSLVVAVNSDSLVGNPSYSSQNHRAEIVASLEFVDACIISELQVAELILELKPWAVVKGKEHESAYNPEKEAMDACGGRLIFSSGDTLQKSSSVFESEQVRPLLNRKTLNGYGARHNITQDSLQKVLECFGQQNVMVIGDTIVDEYIQCNAVGMSQEDPTIVVTPDESKFYLGGAAITAAHAKFLGAKSVSFFTAIGDDEVTEFVTQKLSEYGVDSFTFVDETRPTTLKKRYRVGNKTLLRVNKVKDHDLEHDIQEKVWQAIERQLSHTDTVIFSDFNYGVLPQVLVDRVTDYCLEHGIKLSADSQTSSQVGDISRFQHVDLVTPTEREVRVALNNTRDGLVVLAEKLRQKTTCKNIIVTLAEEGAFIHMPTSGSPEAWANDKIPALAVNVVDPAGAGDCLLASSSLSLASGSDLWTAALIGSVAAACQVSRVGNSPLTHTELCAAVEQLA